MPIGIYTRPMKLCSMKGCNNKHQAKGLCYKHYQKKYHKKYYKKESLKLGISSSKYYNKKRKTDKVWWEKKVKQSRERTRASQATSMKNNPSFKYLRWTKEEVDFIRQNHQKKTNLEIAIELDRTFHAVLGAMHRFRVKRKNRIIQGR